MRHGELRLNGVPLLIGETFTQADIDAGRLAQVRATLERLRIGDLLERLPGDTPQQRRIDLAPVLQAATGEGDAARHNQQPRNPPRDTGELAARMLEEMRAAYARRRSIVLDGLAALKLPTGAPKGAFYAFPDISALGISDEAFAERLLQEE